MVILALVLYFGMNNHQIENFNETSGRLCTTCQDKTFNQCLGCFNCVYCVDKWGNGKCIGGDANSGPYNKEKCARIYSGDQFLRMEQNNANYSCQYGPSNYNRSIGVSSPGNLNAV
jgi:hypothetical protein